ncbi:MAG: hydroxyethylthiazole kinase [Finegoldia sp.]|nr:hydroxyethylthiazole kinase [Finegoldia sp.]
MEKKEIQKNIKYLVEKVRRENPMAGSLTNTVTINLVANAQIAVGGSAAMAYLPDEMGELAVTGGSAYINVGTLFPFLKDTFEKLMESFYKNKSPWVLDPVAIGVGELRTELLKSFKKYKPSIIKGNASEIMALASLWELEENESKVRGVDSTDSVESARQAALALAKYIGGACLVTGESDLITDGKVIVRNQGGSHFMGKITGSGCALGGVCAIYLTSADPFTASLTASQIFKLAGKRAGERVVGPGSFQVAFLDELYLASGQDVADNEFSLEEV